MSNASDFFNVEGGSVPIRGIQEFGSTTPADYTTSAGERFLRRGFVEIDTNNFDTAIWNETWGIVTDRNPDGAKITQADNDTHAKNANYSSVSNEVLIVNGQSTLIASGSLISTDGGDTFNITANFPEVARNTSATYPVHSQGNWSVASHSSANVMVTADSGASWTQYDTGLTSIFGHMGNETAIVVWGSSGNGRRSTDGGITWSNTTGSSLTSSFQIPIIVGSNWYIFNLSTDMRKSSDNGDTWTSHSDVLLGTGHVFSDGVKLYQHANDSDFPITLYESTDGLIWTGLQIPIDLSGDFVENTIGINSKVIKIGSLWIHSFSSGSTGTSWFSKDAVNWKTYVNNDDGTGTSLSYRLGGAIIYNTNFSIDTIEDILFAGDYEKSSEPAGQKLKWVRIT